MGDIGTERRWYEVLPATEPGQSPARAPQPPVPARPRPHEREPQPGR
jgi:hypothetical protein